MYENSDAIGTIEDNTKRFLNYDKKSTQINEKNQFTVILSIPKVASLIHGWVWVLHDINETSSFISHSWLFLCFCGGWRKTVYFIFSVLELYPLLSFSLFLFVVKMFLGLITKEKGNKPIFMVK